MLDLPLGDWIIIISVTVAIVSIGILIKELIVELIQKRRDRSR